MENRQSRCRFASPTASFTSDSFRSRRCRRCSEIGSVNFRCLTLEAGTEGSAHQGHARRSAAAQKSGARARDTERTGDLVAFCRTVKWRETWNLANPCLVLSALGRRRAMTVPAAAREAVMAWTNNDDVRWEPGEISLSPGRTFYWLATLVATVVVIFAI